MAIEPTTNLADATSQSGVSTSNTDALKQMTDTYTQAQAFEQQVTLIKLAGDSALEAVKQRPQV